VETALRFMPPTSWPTNGTRITFSSLDSAAIEYFLLLVFLAYNIFHALLALNLQPHVRAKPRSFGPNSSLPNFIAKSLPPACHPERFCAPPPAFLLVLAGGLFA
jgi:hypothetical protein